MAEQVADFFTDAALLEDPFVYYEQVRARGPVWREPHHGCFVVTGYEESVTVYRDPATFSSCNGFSGPFPPLPEQPEGDDASALIDKYRDIFVSSESLITFDPPQHTGHRALMMRLLTPKRLEENEAFTWRLVDEQIDTFIAAGAFEFVADFAQPVAMLVIADLLGVPPEDQVELRRRIVAKGVAGAVGETMQGNFLAHLDDVFTKYVEDRRREPRDDVMTSMALRTFPDGTLPSVMDVVRVASFLFAGGQGTAARFLTNAVRMLAERPDLQDALRADRSLIAPYVEEMLRFESPVKTNFRMARVTTTLGGVTIPAGSTLMLLLPAADRDPRRFPSPEEFRLDRPRVREHIAFGRGVHSCPGAPLARHECHITLDRMLERMRDIRLSTEHHGEPGARRFDYSPTYILRGVESLHLEFDPA